MANNRNNLLTLAKVLIAAAWADGEITVDEKNCLKDIIFHLTDTGTPLSGQEWALLEMYMDSPIETAERARLVADLQDAISNSAEKQFVINALEQMALADGVSEVEEQRIIREMEEAINNSETGVMDGLNRLLGGALQRRSAAVKSAPNRDAYFDDFLKNKVYYEVSRQLEAEGKSLDLPNEEIRKLGLAGGLMARIANVDQTVSDDELNAMARMIGQHWELTPEAAEFVANVAVSSLDVNYDYYRMTREFATSTTAEERQRFLVALFVIAGADKDVSFEETEEIRLVSRGINVTHQDFIDAKLEAKSRQL
jgi:uncharacterized tellurite resistance protein B-like protein